MTTAGDVPHDDGRGESRAQRADRRWNELLQELRVAQTGTQILFGFLVAVVFQPRFAELGTTDRVIYVVTVCLGAATTGALVAPVAVHRLVAGRRLKPEAVSWAGRLTLVGVVLLYLTMVSTFLLIMRMVLDDGIALWLVVVMALWLALCWFVVPFIARRSGTNGNGNGKAEDGFGPWPR
ncbi:DUF6328 family protein [Streptomyces roseofulvus]|uniref:DUF6328 family protein n=2 Tax=Streptomyces TaxID=1883 RepID=A0ABU4KBC4_9ACTN|nr:DUF6328 family protein [Streptomyces roseolus]MDX2295056.1 DUF6328 family protein [Streptomyces roseolus]